MAATKGSMHSTRGPAIEAPTGTTIITGAVEKKLEEQASGKEPPLQGLPRPVFSTKEGGVKEMQKEASKKVPTPKRMEVLASKIGVVMIEAKQNTEKKAPIMKACMNASFSDFRLLMTVKTK